MHRRDFVKAIGASAAGLASGFARRVRAQPAPESAASQLAAFIDAFTSAPQAETPSDLSAASFAKELAATRASLAKLRAIDPASLTADDRIDRKFAESILVGRELQQAKMQPWRKDPRAYMRFRNTSVGRSLDADGYFISHWEINPFEEQWDEKTKMEYLLEHDWGVIIDTAPHEMYGGHHIQGMYQFYNPRKLRKANGISIFSEGWGL